MPMTVFQCTPIRAIWDKDVKNARCLSVASLGLANAACNIATDVAILILPIPMLQTIQVSGRKKFELYALFGIGILYVPSGRLLHKSPHPPLPVTLSAMAYLQYLTTNTNF